MNAVQQLAPDLALVDITLPGKSGLELVKDLKAMHPQVVILAISMHDESLYAERMLRAGASGYITKQQPPEELIKAIRQVLDKRVYVSKEVSESLLRRFSWQPRRGQCRRRSFSPTVNLKSCSLSARARRPKKLPGNST